MNIALQQNARYCSQRPRARRGKRHITRRKVRCNLMQVGAPCSEGRGTKMEVKLIFWDSAEGRRPTMLSLEVIPS